MKKYLQGTVKGVNSDLKTVRVIASSGAVDREGESLDPNGWDLTNFLKNPVLLWSHDAFSLPIGKVSKVWIENGILMADTQFAEEESDFAAEVARMVRGGYLNAVSVGFLPKDVDHSTGQVRSQELLELSYVNIPANQEALVQSRAFKSFAKAEEIAKRSKQADEKPKEDKQKASNKSYDGLAGHVAALGPIMQQLTEAIENDESTAANDLMNQIETHMMGMADDIDALRSEMGGDKAVETLRQKVGRVISEKNRNQIRLMIDACAQASEAGQKLLDDTTPPDKKGDIKESKAVPADGELRALRIVDRAVEILIQNKKEAVKRQQGGGVTK
jgi:HK97 family phage prohead protease